MKKRLAIPLSTSLFVAALGYLATAQSTPVLDSSLTLRDPGIADQDDMTIWLHPSDLSLSTIIASDKSANKVFVYDLNGATLQTIAAQKPGNIDIRYGFPLSNGGGAVDIVAFNERDTEKIRVYKVNASGLLEQIDDGNINSGPNYGFTLYKSPVTGKFYAFTGPESSTRVRQFELVDSGNGKVSAGAAVRELQQLGTVEGMVADDETGGLYLAEESGGIWKFDAEPGGVTSGTKIAPVGQNGLTADVEGVTIYYRRAGEGYLIASSQGNSTFNVYDRKFPHDFIGTFAVSGVASTDGVDVINLPLGATFPNGIFAVHNGRTSPYPVEVVKWEDIAAALGLTSDTVYWDPRTGTGNSPPSVSITEPANDAGFTRPVNITIKATASDTDGTVTRVEFFQGSNSLGVDTSTPYEFVWNDVPAGNHSLTAKATDNGLATSVSAPVNITVVDPTALPAAPTNLQAKAAKRKINLSWTQSSGPNVTQNNIYRSETAGGPYTLLQSIGAVTGFSDRSVNPGTTYYYVVKAVNSSGESLPSNEASARAR